MKNVLIYISYDLNDYINYFHLIVNGESKLKYVPIERISELFERLTEESISGSDVRLQIVADENSSDWYFEEDFVKYGCTLPVAGNGKALDICEVLEKNFYGRFYFVNEGVNSEGIGIKSLYPQRKASLEMESVHKKEEILTKAIEIMKDEEEMTELAKIIIEKYERMKKHE